MKKMLTTVLLALCFVGFAGVRQAKAETAAFMLVPGVPGESEDSRYRNWINVISVAQTLQKDHSDPQCSVQVTKWLDRSGPLLWLAAVTGQAFEEIEIDVVHVNNNDQSFYRIKLQNATITSISTIESSTAGIVERITLDAGSIQLWYRPFLRDGSPGRPVTSSFAC